MAITTSTASSSSSNAATGGPSYIDIDSLQPGTGVGAPGTIPTILASVLLGVPIGETANPRTGRITYEQAAEQLGYAIRNTQAGQFVGAVKARPSEGTARSQLVRDYYAGTTNLSDSLGRSLRAENLARDFLNTYATGLTGENLTNSIGFLKDQFLSKGYGPGVEEILTRTGPHVEQPFYSTLRADPEFKAFTRAADLFSTYIPGYQPNVREVVQLGTDIQDSSFNRAKGQFLSELATDPRYAEAYVGSPAARERGPLGYEPVEFTGITGLQTTTPEYLAAREAVKTNVAKSLLGSAPEDQTFGQTGLVAGAVPMGYAGEVGREAPDVYAGVPAAAARPLTNMSPADFAAQDITLNIAKNRATGYADVYGNPVNAPIYGSPISTTGGLASLTADQVAAAQMAAAQEAQAVADAQSQAAAAAPAASTPVSMKEGGVASLADDAEAVRGAGRYGDDRLVHVNSEELGIMQGIFGKPTINPKTGLPEFFLGKIFKGIGKIFKKVLSVAAKVVPFVANFIPGLQPFAPVIAGIAGAFSGGKFDLKRGILSGLLSYGAGQAFSGLKAAAGGAGAASSAAQGVAGAADDVAFQAANTFRNPEYFTKAGNIIEGALPASASVANVATPGVVNTAAGRTTFLGNVAEGVDDAAAAAARSAAPSITQQVTSALSPSNIVSGLSPSNLMSEASQVGGGLRNILTGQPGAFSRFTTEFGRGPALSLAAGASGIQALDEQQAFEEEQRRLQEEEERKQRENIAFFRQNTVPFEFSAAQGGEVDDEPGYDMARGGKVLPPRYLSGGGDGMSDSIPANIDGKRPARLADGEFVIPADVVSHLGNGSSKAGAKRLYDMMDRVRKARTGTKRQGREINPMRMMPA